MGAGSSPVPTEGRCKLSGALACSHAEAPGASVVRWLWVYDLVPLPPGMWKAGDGLQAEPTRTGCSFPSCYPVFSELRQWAGWPGVSHMDM